MYSQSTQIQTEEFFKKVKAFLPVIMLICLCLHPHHPPSQNA